MVSFTCFHGGSDREGKKGSTRGMVSHDHTIINQIYQKISYSLHDEDEDDDEDDDPFI